MMVCNKEAVTLEEINEETGKKEAKLIKKRPFALQIAFFYIYN